MNTPSHGSEHPSSTPTIAHPRVLPPRPSLEHLRNEAKRRFEALKATAPSAKLTQAQFQLAREYGFTSWRALKIAVESGAALVHIEPTGDWIGQTSTAAAVALHIGRTEGGALRATLDVPSQGYFGDPVERLAVEGGRLSFVITVRGVNVLYEADWDAEAEQWRGTWTQTGLQTSLAFRRGVLAPAPVVEGLDGLWDGRLQVKDGVNLTFRITTDERGTLASLESSTRHGTWFPAVSIQRQGGRVSIAMRSVEVSGQLSRNCGQIEGRWTRGGTSAPLTLIRRAPGAAAPRGPTPEPVAMAPNNLAAFAGTYAYPTGAVTTLAVEDGRLRILTPDGRPAFELVPSGPVDFFCREIDATAAFELDDAGRASAMLMRHKDQDSRLIRVG